MAPTTRSAPPRGRRAPACTPSRIPVRRGRASSAKSKQQGGLGGMLARFAPKRTAAKATPSSKGGKAGGVALLAAAAGVAFRNRDKLAGMLQGRGRRDRHEAQPTTTPAPPQQPAANTPGV
jgi:hypothetical protein